MYVDVTCILNYLGLDIILSPVVEGMFLDGVDPHLGKLLGSTGVLGEVQEEGVVMSYKVVVTRAFGEGESAVEVFISQEDRNLRRRL